MKFFTSLIFFFLFFLSKNENLNAQEIVTSGGDFFSNPAGSISWTLGEPISENFTVSPNVFSQGFQQSAQNYAHLTSSINIDLFEIYPNPFDEIIFIQFQSKEKNLMVSLYDEKLALIKQTTINTDFSKESKLSFGGLAAGLYFLHLESEDGKINSMQKVIKKSL